MEILGTITLLIFIVTLVATLLGWIKMPVQTVLIGITLVNIVLALIFFGLQGMADELRLVPADVIGRIILHPVTALLGGLFMGGVLGAAGGFEAIKAIVNRLRKTPLGLAGTLVILINIPLITMLPCGRIIAAALLPLLFMFGPEGSGTLRKTQLIVFIAAFARNSFGSCGPSPVGGVAQIAEGTLGGATFPDAAAGILRGPQVFSLMIGTAFMALFIRFVTKRLYPEDTVQIKDREGGVEPEIKVNWKGYTSLIIFALALLTATFISFIPSLKFITVQAIFVAASILIIIVCRVSLGDLMTGIILMPATAMVAGFLAAGSLYPTGGMQVLQSIFKGLAAFPLLGVVGTLVILVQAQTILPLSCSRILTAVFVPLIYVFGKGVGLTDLQIGIVMAAYIINATTSCAPSPLGGAGMMAEGQLRAETGYLKGAFSFTSLAVMAPLAAVFMRFITLDVFARNPQTGQMMFTATWGHLGQTILWSLVIMAAAYGLIVVMSRLITASLGRNRKVLIASFGLGGVLCGISLALALRLGEPVAGTSLGVSLVQGIIGGIIAAVLIALMIQVSFAGPPLKENVQAVEG
ncbi:MAG: hypothetical protein E3J72_08600 [Planctomycetota bacterium]|nr:MAG: hypothetical protein E3J72_08600 [Planctomycetota bacterium]